MRLSWWESWFGIQRMHADPTFATMTIEETVDKVREKLIEMVKPDPKHPGKVVRITVEELGSREDLTA